LPGKGIGLQPPTTVVRPEVCPDCSSADVVERRIFTIAHII
jgi:hypothetical protein